MERNIACFADFCAALEETGFTIGGENGEGIFTLCDRFAPGIAWHTEQAETDPWEWRMRVLSQREDIAYAKVFFGKSGYITRAWYPYFLAARRGGESARAQYERGAMSHDAWKIYCLLEQEEQLPLHQLKAAAGFGREEKSAFERALTALQMDLLITICGQRRKYSAVGMEYGWNSTAFCLTERFFGLEVLREAAALSGEDAAAQIKARVLEINPHADARKMEKFIFGLRR